jgi:ribonuclease HI
MTDTATMHIDGASRGNPGPAAFAVVLARPGQPVVEIADVIGKATNNVAEYTALVEGLELAAELGVKKLAVFSDSELMVKQMRGEYRVKSEDLQELYAEAKRLAAVFDEFKITHVRREQNKRADEIGNEALDGKPRRKGQPPVSASPTVSGNGAVGSGALNPAAQGERMPKAPATVVGDAAVRDDGLAILRSAAQAWAANGVNAVPVEAIWEQLWSVLDEGGVLKKMKAK